MDVLELAEAWTSEGRPAALATVVGVLVEVPVMLSLVTFANRTSHWFPKRTRRP
mgnify:CR=1 FL=1